MPARALERSDALLARYITCPQSLNEQPRPSRQVFGWLLRLAVRLLYPLALSQSTGYSSATARHHASRPSHAGPPRPHSSRSWNLADLALWYDRVGWIKVRSAAPAPRRVDPNPIPWPRKSESAAEGEAKEACRPDEGAPANTKATTLLCGHPAPLLGQHRPVTNGSSAPNCAAFERADLGRAAPGVDRRVESSLPQQMAVASWSAEARG